MLKTLIAFAVLACAGSALAEELPLNAQQYAGMMKQDDQDEITFARQIAQKTQDTDVRSFAQQLASDHQRSLDQLQQFASKNGVDLNAFKKEQLSKSDQKLDDAFQSMRQAVLAADGKDLDQLFLGYNLAEHDHDILDLTNAQQKFTGTALSGLISQTLPMIREHRARAYQLLKQTGPQRQARKP